MGNARNRRVLLARRSGDKEKASGMPLTPMCDRTSQARERSAQWREMVTSRWQGRVALQKGFVDFVIGPYYKLVAAAFPNLTPVPQRLHECTVGAQQVLYHCLPQLRALRLGSVASASCSLLLSRHGEGNHAAGVADQEGVDDVDAQIPRAHPVDRVDEVAHLQEAALRRRLLRQLVRVSTAREQLGPNLGDDGDDTDRTMRVRLGDADAQSDSFSDLTSVSQDDDRLRSLPLLLRLLPPPFSHHQRLHGRCSCLWLVGRRLGVVGGLEVPTAVRGGGAGEGSVVEVADEVGEGGVGVGGLRAVGGRGDDRKGRVLPDVAQVVVLNIRLPCSSRRY
eukprot:767240-Hanusia_phi.AAC.3